MIDKLSQELLNAATAVLESKSVEQLLTEQMNAHEEVHKKVLKDLHKAYPEMNVKNSTHMEKRKDYDGNEVHKYESDIPVHDSVKHLFSSLKATTSISHNKDGGHYATLSYAYTHPAGGSNGSTVAHHMTHEGKNYIRHQATGLTKEV